MPDAARFGDHDVDTFGHICDIVGTLNIPNLKKLGLLNLHPTKEMEEEKHPIAYYTRLKETSNGKDTMTGHWEMMGLKIEKPFLTFTDTGFPPELIHELEERCGKKVIGNKCASGTQILDELGEEEIKNGSMIVYTSADSVMQICGNEETFDLKNLYRCCEIARELTMKNEWKVGRIIARPYVGKKKGEFVRTSNRRDYALKPFSRTALNALKDEGFDVISVGKINDIFCGEGITKAYHSESSVHGMQQTVDVCKEDFHEDDLLIITADHGNDPTYTGTDHTREYTPFIAYSKSMKENGRIEDQDTFAVIGATIADNFGVTMPEGTIGTSLLSQLK